MISGRIENTARLAVPYVVLALFMCVGFLAIPFSQAHLIKPNLVLMAVYYWAIYRPTLFSPFLCFSVGLLMDFLMAMPLGMNAMILLVVQWQASDQRRFLMGQPYMALWAIFGLVVAAISCAQWLLFGVFLGQWHSLLAMLFGIVVNVLLFPFVTMILVQVHRILPVASRSLP